MGDDIGDRMKSFESQYNQTVLKQLPVIVRLDGSHFHTFTKKMARPYDVNMSSAMTSVMHMLVKEFNPLVGYTQSDEISLLFYPKTFKSEIPFCGKVNKINSTFAAFAATTLDRLKGHFKLNCKAEKIECFDCRTFNVPSKEEAANYFYWREKDATKNAISMAAQSMFSHKELHGKNGSDKQEMMFQKGTNFNDYPNFFKRGSWSRKFQVKKDKDGKEYVRTEVRIITLTTPFSAKPIEDRVQFLFSDLEVLS